MPNRSERRSQSRHVRKLFNGRASAEQVHAKFAFPPTAKCGGCGRRPYVRAITLAPLDEAKKRLPGFAELMVMDPNSVMQQIVQIRESATAQMGKPYVRVGVAYACQTCSPAMERELAKAPSWMICEINRPRPDRFVIGTAGGSSVD